MTHERKCVVCGKAYQYCPRCKQYSTLPRWKIDFDCEECKEVYDAVDKFIFKHITAEEAKKILTKSKVQVKNNEIQKTIASILATEDKKKIQKKTEEIVNED